MINLQLFKSCFFDKQILLNSTSGVLKGFPTARFQFYIAYNHPADCWDNLGLNKFILKTWQVKSSWVILYIHTRKKFSKKEGYKCTQAVRKVFADDAPKIHTASTLLNREIGRRMVSAPILSYWPPFLLKINRFYNNYCNNKNSLWIITMD